MFFILRMVFWLAVVALLLPTSPGQHEQGPATTTASLTEKAVSAAISFCTTNAESCAAGLDGARRLGDLLDGKAAPAAGQAPAALQHLVALPPPRPAIP